MTQALHPVVAAAAEFLEALEARDLDFARRNSEAEATGTFIDVQAWLAPYNASVSKILSDLDAITPDCADKVWNKAFRASMENPTKSRRWKARALGLDPAPLHNAIALSGIAPLLFDQRWHLAVAVPAPPPIGRPNHEIEDIVIIDPKSGRTTMFGTDLGPRVIAPRDHDLATPLCVLTDPIEWARRWAQHRIEWFLSLSESRRVAHIEPTWTGEPPCALLVGDPARADWLSLGATVLDLPEAIVKPARAAMFRDMHLPRIQARA